MNAQAIVSLQNLAYVVAAVLFIVALKGLTHPRTAVRGNLLGAVGMLVAVVAVLFDLGIVSYWHILLGLVVGGAVGLWMAKTVPMTAMPQFVALFNGLGGGASMIVAGTALIVALDANQTTVSFNIATGLSAVIGAVTLFGSLVAVAKLQEVVISGNPIVFRGHQFINALLFFVSAAIVVYLAVDPGVTTYWVLSAVAAILGILLVLPIGGADMPVVIALLNAYSGLAAAATGFVLNNNGLIIAGSLVGASGIILTSIMCKAMNRSLTNVLFGAVGAVPALAAKAEDVYGGKIKATSAEEIAMILEAARRVVFVPGYGLAVAQAQHAVRDLANVLEARGVDVEFAIHPVAGRMPGHMNVLLAEADVPYEQLKEMEEINPSFDQTDVAIVIGANDVVNPVARTDPKSPIAGMPILNVDKARSVIVVKRSLSPGFAGIPNPLFALDNTMMYFADGKKALLDILVAVKEL